MKAHMKQLLVIVLASGACALSSMALAETYKCTKNGAITYSQAPCSDGVSITATTPDGAIPLADYQDAIKRNRKDEITLKKIQDKRDKEDARYEKEMRAVAAKNAKAKQKCIGLQANSTWAKEDLANAQPKAENKARLKLKRANEKLALYCKTS